MVIYDENYFNSGGAVGGYDNYNENSCSSETSAQLAVKIIDTLEALGSSILGKKVLDVGCGYGFLVKHLISLGVDAYGMDSSPYALTQVPSEITGRIMLGSATIESDFQDAKTLAGLTRKNDKFDLILDQDMIVCLDDTEATIFLALAKKYGNFTVHYLENSPHISKWYNYKTMNEWRTFSGGVNPKEKWYSRLTWIE